MACGKEDITKIVRCLCNVHKKDLVPLVCKDCDSPVCFDYLTTNHVGHRMGKLSECIDYKIDQLNDVVQKKYSACFELQLIEENIKRRRQEIEQDVKEMTEQVEDRKVKILNKVEIVARETLQRITKLAKEIQKPMVRDVEFLNSFSTLKLFQNDSEEECIKGLYFHNELKVLNKRYASQSRVSVPFSFVYRDLSTEKIEELFGLVLTDEFLSSDENLQQNDTPNNPHETKHSDGDIKPYQCKKTIIEGAVDSIVLVSGETCLFRSNDDVYYQSKTEVKRMMENAEHFSYVPETDEILVILKGKTQILRGPATSSSKQLSFFLNFDCEEVVCMGHNSATYLVAVLKEFSQTEESKRTCTRTDLIICTIDGTGCRTKQNVRYKNPDVCNGRIKVHKSSFLILYSNKVCITKEFAFTNLFSYTGSIGYKSETTFSPVDVCTDLDGNFLVIDSHDDTVHLLDPKGKFLQIIMSAEDGLSGIICITMDTFGWMLMGCKDGIAHFANYQYFKSTTRKERCLERQKKMKRRESFRSETNVDTVKLEETDNAQLAN